MKTLSLAGRGTLVRSFTLGFVWFACLALSTFTMAGPQLSGCSCYWQCYNNTNNVSGTPCTNAYLCRVWPYTYTSSGFAEAPAAPFVNHFVVAIVTESNVVLTASGAKVNGKHLATDGAISAGQSNLFAEELSMRGLYNSATQRLSFFRTSQPFTLTNGSTGAFSAMFNGGIKLTRGRAVAFVTTETDVDDGLPLEPLLIVNDDLARDPPPMVCEPIPIPTLSEWGMIVFAAALLAIGSRATYRLKRCVPNDAG